MPSGEDPAGADPEGVQKSSDGYFKVGCGGRAKVEMRIDDIYGER